MSDLGGLDEVTDCTSLRVKIHGNRSGQLNPFPPPTTETKYRRSENRFHVLTDCVEANVESTLSSMPPSLCCLHRSHRVHSSPSLTSMKNPDSCLEMAELKESKGNLIVTSAAMSSNIANTSTTVGGSVIPPVTLAAVQATTLSRKAVDRRRYLAGFAAGCVSRTCTAPIDRLKVLRQTAVPEIAGRNMFHSFKVMIADGGLRSLWRGNGVNVLKNGPETALRFGFHGRLKDVLFPGAKDLQPSQRFLVASLAGAGSLTLTYPLEVMKTRMALRRTGDPNSIVRCLQTIFQQGGFRSFYRGYTISMLSYVPYSGMELSFYELFKRSYMVHFHNYHPGDPMPHLSAPAAIALIVCSSFLPMLVVYPANLLRTRFQASTCSRPMPILGTARNICRADGMLGLYRGFLTSLTKTLPSVTISYLTFEFVMELMHLPTLGSR